MHFRCSSIAISFCIAKAIQDSECDDSTRKKNEKDEKLGALWHIYRAKDTDTNREFLTKVRKIRSSPL